MDKLIALCSNITYIAQGNPTPRHYTLVTGKIKANKVNGMDTDDILRILLRKRSCPDRVSMQPTLEPCTNLEK